MPEDGSSSNNLTAGIIGVAIGALGLLTAIVTNLGSINQLISEWTGVKVSASSPIDGEWLGVYREYAESPNSIVNSQENLKFEGDIGKLKGHIVTDIAPSRKWTINFASYDNHILVYEYRGDTERPDTGGAYVLYGDASPQEAKLRGYLVGYDHELHSLVTCPYVLSKIRDADRVRRDEKKFFDDNKCAIVRQ
jgi:hypothetical protein